MSKRIGYHNRCAGGYSKLEQGAEAVLNAARAREKELRGEG